MSQAAQLELLLGCQLQLPASYGRAFPPPAKDSPGEKASVPSGHAPGAGTGQCPTSLYSIANGGRCRGSVPGEQREGNLPSKGGFDPDHECVMFSPGADHSQAVRGELFGAISSQGTEPGSK